MAQLIEINNHHFPVREYNGQRVLTFSDIEKAHGRPAGTARKRFNDNRKHFISGTDYYRIQPSEIRTVGVTSPNGAIVLTESGYLMLAKSFTDDLAWTVQRELVNCYFHVKAEKTAAKCETEPEQLTLETAEYHYFDKMYNGEPVLTAADVEHFTGLNQNSIAWYLKKYGKRGKDFFLLTKGALRAYKEENPSVSKLSSAAFLVTKSGFKKALKYYDRKANMPECFIESKTPKLPEKSAAGAVEIKLPEKPEIQPRREFTAAEYIVALEVLNSLRIKFRENLSRPNCFYPEVEENNIKSINVAMEYVAMPLSVGTKI